MRACATRAHTHSSSLSMAFVGIMILSKVSFEIVKHPLYISVFCGLSSIPYVEILVPGNSEWDCYLEIGSLKR